MAATRDTDPYSQFHFRMTFADDEATGPQGGFTEISGLATKLTIAEYRDGNSKDSVARKLPAVGKVTDITLKRGMMARDAFGDWLNAASNGNDAWTVRIDLMGEDGTTRVGAVSLMRTSLRIDGQRQLHATN